MAPSISERIGEVVTENKKEIAIVAGASTAALVRVNELGGC